ncbi:hypothetical protein [Nocardia sp. NPDC058497]|uniref:hypothetical protein n=1 Tax=Nocardia sp. NPDC058497 TaxID=3346529 RepID=UPI00365055FF
MSGELDRVDLPDPHAVEPDIGPRSDAGTDLADQQRNPDLVAGSAVGCDAPGEESEQREDDSARAE